ncbi:MAG TPA: hypothetical protein VIV11_15875 [Kofleriaceae bacterium]
MTKVTIHELLSITTIDLDTVTGGASAFERANMGHWVSSGGYSRYSYHNNAQWRVRPVPRSRF